MEVVPASAFVGRKPFVSPVQPLLFHVYFWSPQTRVVKLASSFSVSFVVAMGSCTPVIRLRPSSVETLKPAYFIFFSAVSV